MLLTHRALALSFNVTALMESCLRNKKEDNTSLSVESSIQCSHRFSSENIRSATKSLKLASTRRKKEHTFFFFSFDDIISGHKGNYDCIKSVEVISLIQSKKNAVIYTEGA